MKITEKKIIHKTPYLNFVGTSFLNKENKEDVWYSAERYNGGKTVVVAAISDAKLIVTKEFRVPIGGYEWGIPAGLVDGDELPEDTAKRELKEETNLELISVQEVTPYLYNSAGMTNEVASIVFCTADGKIGTSGTEATEDIECFLMDKMQLKELMQQSGAMISAKAYLIFDRFIRNGSW
ncbi:MAG: NUDIX hydrolase [Chloroflexia bacterium]|nr:NUDIX hydrolase [Chloroflexia bacterium]